MKNKIKIAGRTFRVEFNWNAMADYCDLSGISDLSRLDNLGVISAHEMRTFIFCAIKEGERMDGRELELSPVDLGALLRPDDIGRIMSIYSSQTTSGINHVNNNQGEETKKKRRFSFMK